MNKTIPPILKRVGQSLPVEWTDKWGHTCSISNGYWGAKNYRVMDALGYMFLLKDGGDCLPENAEPLFNDLVDIQQRESQLNGCAENVLTGNIKHYIRFDDDHFRQFTKFAYELNRDQEPLAGNFPSRIQTDFSSSMQSNGSKRKHTYHELLQSFF